MHKLFFDWYTNTKKYYKEVTNSFPLNETPVRMYHKTDSHNFYYSSIELINQEMEFFTVLQICNHLTFFPFKESKLAL